MPKTNKFYVKNIKKQNITIEEERKLFKLIQDKDKKLSSIARDKIIKCNQRFVVFVAKYYSNNELILDLIDARTNKLVWQGIGSGISVDSPRSKQKQIPEIVAEIMANYPPKR